MFPGYFKRGPMGAYPCSSWGDVLARYGDIMDDYDSAYLVKRLMTLYGARAIVNRLAHYEDPSDVTSLTATCGTATLVDRAGSPLPTLGITVIGPGSHSANIKWTVTDGTINPTTEFNITFEDEDDSRVVPEGYQNCTIANVLDKVNGVSKIVTLADLESATVAPDNRPANGTGNLSEGDDGLTNLNAADWIGDEAAGTGLYAFDDYDQSMLLVAPESVLLSGAGPETVQAAVQTYCNTHRKQLVFAIHTPPDGLIPTDAADYRNGKGKWDYTPINDWCGAMYWGDLAVLDPRTGNKLVYINPAADVAGRIARAHVEKKEWFAAAGPKFGNLKEVHGVRYNLGPVAKEGYRDILAEAQVNPIIVDEDGCYIDGIRTLQRETTQLQNSPVAWLMMVMKKALYKYARSYRYYKIGPATWALMYSELNPWLAQLKKELGFAEYYLQVDQDAPDIMSGKINTPETIERGILMGDIAVKPIPDAQWVGFVVGITKLSMTFEDYEKISVL
ncbi:MAG: hypothetical protein WCP22_07955 [Chlamydiota bacterium]